MLLVSGMLAGLAVQVYLYRRDRASWGTIAADSWVWAAVGVMTVAVLKGALSTVHLYLIALPIG